MNNTYNAYLVRIFPQCNIQVSKNTLPKGIDHFGDHGIINGLGTIARCLSRVLNYEARWEPGTGDVMHRIDASANVIRPMRN